MKVIGNDMQVPDCHSPKYSGMDVERVKSARVCIFAWP